MSATLLAECRWPPVEGLVSGWEFWIDRGGTFTDIVARDPQGQLHQRKLLSENPQQYADAAVHGVRTLLGQAPLHSIKMGTTVATNALLERRGARAVLVMTAGLADVLRIGGQNRPQLFSKKIVLPDMLYEQVVEVCERHDARGRVLTELDLQATRRALQAAFDAGMRACAVVLLHADRYPEHEQRVGDLARQVGFTQVSMSHMASPMIKIVPRGDTTLVDAYLSPTLRRYVDQVQDALPDARLYFMQSNGGLVRADKFAGKDSILSGPAGGIVGAAALASACGFDKIITFDMGGTSTDVALYAGRYERVLDTQVAGVRVRVPMLDIHTVAAGGGSLVRLSQGRFRVGPQSAGADPGPAAYRRGGPLTVTDCNLMVGKLQPRLFPSMFGPAADAPLDAEATHRGFEVLRQQIREETGDSRDAQQVAEGFLQVAVQNVARAIKHISIARGHDVTAYTLCTFGGAGGQHACAIADALGMQQVLVPPFAGVLSAYGMGLADMRVVFEQGVEQELGPRLVPELRALMLVLQTRGQAHMRDQGVAAQRVVLERRLRLRYAGSEATLEVADGELEQVGAAFAEAHRERFGFTLLDRPLVVSAVAVEAIGQSEHIAEAGAHLASQSRLGPLQPLGEATFFSGGVLHAAAVYDRDGMCAGDVLRGPCIVREAAATTVVEPGWQAAMGGRGELLLRRMTPRPRQRAVGTTADPVMLEVFNNLFMSIAEHMGTTLAQTAQSVNIKERLDFSCAVFDGEGALIANAPHVPVHLGSMGESVRRVHAANLGHLRPGDAYALNAPYSGGTHLPDITVVTPVFDEAGDRLLFYVASRGHHADVGGITPGSMPPNSVSVHDEGVLLDNFLLVQAGDFRQQAFVQVLTAGPHPARNPSQNVADIQAQIAANAQGARELLQMVRTYSLATVQAYMQHVQDNAEEAVRRVIDVLRDGAFTYAMDDGSEIAVRLRIDRAARTAHIDFSGTSPQRPNNFNAPTSVTTAAVLYVFRTLVDDDIPLNAGCLKPIEIHIPAGCMLNPAYPAAVVAGNVETSQCITDALFGALGVMAAAQGTMNNLTFGNDAVQYYETVCGGAGAGPDFDGADAVHTHMTNSRLTDPEVLERRYPVLLESFGIRRGSGGAGKHRGGHGVTRRLRFLEPVTLSILSNRRRIPPYGMAGGGSGALGINRIERRDGSRQDLASTATVELQAGDVFVLETPGGGGYGAP